MYSDKLLKIYSILPFPNDPESREGREYYLKTLNYMERLLRHPWMIECSKRGKVRILELCSGAGFGGVALSKLLEDKGVEVELHLTDLRVDVLERGKRWAFKALKGDVRAEVLDAREAYKLGREFDVALIYGLSTPHFTPWDLVKVYSSVGEVLSENGIVIVEEVDRRYTIFFLLGYKWALLEGNEEKPVVSYHAGYDVLKGTFKRLYVGLKGYENPIAMETYFWGVAESAAFLWCFFEELEFVNLERYRYFILGRRPRRKITPSELKKPKVIE